MSETRWTPGPWRARREPGSTVVAVLADAGPPFGSNGSVGHMCALNPSAAQANANLAAAAPTLYEALADLHALVVEAIGDDEKAERYEIVLRRTNVALSLARGEPVEADAS